MKRPPDALLRSCRSLLAGLLALALTACGGGGQDSDGAADDTAPPADDSASIASDAGVAASAATQLRRRLAGCPYADSLINTPVACLTGIWEGRTTGRSPSRCAMHYRADGDVYYLAGGRARRIELSWSASGSVYEKARAGTASGFRIAYSIGIASGQDAGLYYQDRAHRRSADGLLFQPASSAVPACLFTAPPAAAATGAASTKNLTGRSWLRPTRLDDGQPVVALQGEPGFDAGMADDGTATLAYRTRIDGRAAVAVVAGRPGAADRPAAWSDPVVLDAAAPLLAEAGRPRLAMSRTGHAVVSWIALRPCEGDSYEQEPAGKSCRYLYASRRLATDAAWEPARRVRAASARGDLDQVPRIDAAGDVAILFTTFRELGFSATDSAIAWRRAGDAGYRLARLGGWWSNPFDDAALSTRILIDLDDAGALTVAGRSSSTFSGLRYVRLPLASLPATLTSPDEDDAGNAPYGLAVGDTAGLLSSGRIGLAFPRMPETFTAYSTNRDRWLAPRDATAQVMWGDSRLVGSQRSGGELLLYSGCRVTAWRDGSWGSTAKLPAYCGLDRDAGVYAFNRRGDYIGLNWAGRAGQWGVYRRSDNTLRKGPPGSGRARAGDYLLGTRSGAFADDRTQLFLSPDGLALAVTSNDYTRLPSASDPRGRRSGDADKLWATYLK